MEAYEFNNSQDNIYQVTELIRALRRMRDASIAGAEYNPNGQPTDYYAVITSSEEKNYFIQLLTLFSCDKFKMEASAVHKDKDRLSKEKIDWLLNHEWFAPCKNHPNYDKVASIYSEKDLYMLAAEIVTTFIKVYDFIPTDVLKIQIDEAQLGENPRKFSFAKKTKRYFKTLLGVLSDMIKVD
jgi:hypothetical protein